MSFAEKPWVQRVITRKSRDKAYRKKYGISLKVYEDLLWAQGCVCAICHRPCRKGRLSVDHCHKTGRVRGLACRACNVRLAALEDEDWRRRAEAYLAGGLSE